MSTRARTESDTQRLERHYRELSILNTIAKALNQEVDLTRALNAALTHVAELFDLKTSWIFLYDQEGKAYLAAAQNLPPALADHPRRMTGECDCLWYYEEGLLPKPENITCTRLENLVVGTAGLRQHASIPLNAQEKQLGVLNVASTDWGDLSDEDLQLLYLVSDLVGIAIQRARLFDNSVELGAVKERNRLAREIHDTLAQGLTAITLQLETADALLEGDGSTTRAQQAVRQALELARGNLEEARRSVLDLRAAPLEGRTLAGALGVLVKEWAARRKKVTVQLDTADANRPLPVRIEVGLYRIAQEALTNIGRYAQARNVAVQLTTMPEQVHMVIHDDGRGFDPSLVDDGHYGLVGMNERAKLLGGSLELCSSPGGGTRIDVFVPLEMKHE
jgi:two-component system NarL family sensor kinase